MQVNLYADGCDRWQFYRKWIPGKDLAVWEPGSKWNATASNRLRFCKRSGYSSVRGFDVYNSNLDDIFSINTSAEERQGNPMNPAYFEFPTPKNVDNPCPKHSYYCTLVMKEGVVYAYAVLHVMGELMNVSTIIGHYDRLKDGIMLLLTEDIQRIAVENNVKAVTYGTWDSGTDGLRYFKHSTGFKSMKLWE